MASILSDVLLNACENKDNRYIEISNNADKSSWSVEPAELADIV